MISWRVDIVCDRCGTGESAIAMSASDRIATHLPIGWEPNYLGQQLCTTCKGKPAEGARPLTPEVKNDQRASDAAFHALTVHCWNTCPKDGPHEAVCYDLRESAIAVLAAPAHAPAAGQKGEPATPEKP